MSGVEFRGHVGVVHLKTYHERLPCLSAGQIMCLSLSSPLVRVIRPGSGARQIWTQTLHLFTNVPEEGVYLASVLLMRHPSGCQPCGALLNTHIVMVSFFLMTNPLLSLCSSPFSPPPSLVHRTSRSSWPFILFLQPFRQSFFVPLRGRKISQWLVDPCLLHQCTQFGLPHSGEGRIRSVRSEEAFQHG